MNKEIQVQGSPATAGTMANGEQKLIAKRNLAGKYTLKEHNLKE